MHRKVTKIWQSSCVTPHLFHDLARVVKRRHPDRYILNWTPGSIQIFLVFPRLPPFCPRIQCRMPHHWELSRLHSLLGPGTVLHSFLSFFLIKMLSMVIYVCIVKWLPQSNESPCFSRSWQFWEVLVSSSIEFPPGQFASWFAHDWLALVNFWKELLRGEVLSPCVQLADARCQQGLWMLVPRLRRYLQTRPL